MSDLERHDYDVLVIGAGGAGLRAAIEAREQGLRTAIICKSLFGKAHTVMAEGGIAASMGNVNSKDNWQVHFRDTMRGGKFLNNPRMAELHAKEAPQRVWELETYGALFDRTPEGKISQRNFGGHEYPRLAHVGDRTGLELIRTLQQKIVSLQQEDLREHGDFDGRIRVFAECTVTDLLKDATGAVSGAFGYWRESGRFVVFEAPAVILATGGIGKSFKVTSNSWEYTGDGHALALRAGATLINMEFIQFHPTGMVWPPSVKGILVTESVRGDGGVLRNSEGKRFMFDYVPDVFRASTPTPRRRPTAGTRTRTTTSAPRSCCPATRSPAPSTTRSRKAAAHRTAGSSWTSRPGSRPTRSSSGCRRCTTSSRSWPTSTSRPSRWRSVRPATTSWAASRSTPTPRPPSVPGLYRRGRGRRRHARLEPAGRQLAVRPAGLRPARRHSAPRSTSLAWASDPAIDDADVDAAAETSPSAVRRRRTARRTRTRCTRSCSRR